MTHRILRIDASARAQGSVTRDLTGRITALWPAAHVLHRDLAANPLPHLTEDWVSANFTPHANRTAAQEKALALSDSLIDELRAADTLVIGLPVYNFGVPSALKAWIDHVARAGVTFRYTETGPEGLLTGKRAILAMASGGTQAGAEIDYASTYMRHILGFVGITDVTVVAADQLALDADASLARALDQIGELQAA
ncbi:(Acyl-carrier protein) phosphodiesterase [Roseobacter sp. AzwK-3b]|uniref:FMN-dependent NADH-azoreductase n=1 Tax=Roseobacter sp. AzwK-3b TaxID=351016 RepID=UPI000156AEAD|nr:NAD(P)H-dependent oxidoreductase [Roseobacter sp. AzwK-3b]EDM70567.1 (Acyl-carrier protein) phosphodiesterase [Roseobacter sp. AzwK-3b]